MLYRCTVCSELTDEVIPPPAGQVVECTIRNCGGECERVQTCDVPGCMNERLSECDEVCCECAIASIATDPAFFYTLTSSSKGYVAGVMARRLRGIDLTRRQAA